MIIYKATKKTFMMDVDNDKIAIEIEYLVHEKMHHYTSDSERRSWENSLNYMYRVLNDPSIPSDVGIAIEYNIPLTSKRIDFLISGFSKEHEPRTILIELKQWSELKALPGQDAIVETYTGGAIRKVVHPSYQAWSYAQQLHSYNDAVHKGGISIIPCAYLHNYKRLEEGDPIDAEQYCEHLSQAPVFAKGEVNELRKFINEYIEMGDNLDVIHKMDSGRINPSKSLQDAILQMLNGNAEFVMLDEQKIAYESVMNAAHQSVKDNKKSVIIVKGGPGTGKSVIAINLLAALTSLGHSCQYISKNAAPRNVYKKKLQGSIKEACIENMFRSADIHVCSEENTVDVILADEAHRLSNKSGRYSRGENQIKEIIHAAKCSVFFIDEHQRVTLFDIGSIAEIKQWASQMGASVEVIELVSQFRCNGSDGYLTWLDNTLQICNTTNMDMEDVDYDIRICDSPEEMQELILKRNQESKNKARILAGYCWDWNKKDRNNPSIHEVTIGNFSISWNLNNTKTFAIDEYSVEQAGCIHTSQGLEFDYVGVIIGDDMRYEDGLIVTDFSKRASTDRSLFGIKKLSKENDTLAKEKADEIIKNTYRTLMTRGMKGCYVYCTNKCLSKYLKQSLGSSE